MNLVKIKATINKKGINIILFLITYITLDIFVILYTFDF